MSDRGLQAEREAIRIPVYSEDDLTTQNNYSSAWGQGQEFINCIPQVEQNSITKEGTIVVTKRPGLAYVSTSVLVDGQITGNMTPKDHITMTMLQDVNVLAVFDHADSKIKILAVRPANGTIYKVGEISGCNVKDYCFLTELQITTSSIPYLAVVWTKYDKSASKAYYAASSGGVLPASTLTQITDTDFPDQQTPAKVCTGRFVQLDLTTYIMTTDGYIYNSDLNSITAWNTLGNLQAYNYPDRGIGLIRYKNHIVAMGEASMEFYSDIGQPSPKSPLGRTDQAFIKFGCVDPKCMINIDDNLYWIAASGNVTDGVWKLEGYTPVKISNAKRDMQIANAYNQDDNSYNMYLRSIVTNGVTNLLITGMIGYANVPYKSLNTTGMTDAFSTSTSDAVYTTLCYCIDSGAWWGWKDANTSDYNVFLPTGYYPVTGGLVQNKFLQFIIKGKGTTGDTPAYYSLESSNNDNLFQDQTSAGGATAATAVCAIIQFIPLEFQSSKRKFMSKLNVVMDIVNTSETTASIFVVYSKDDNTSTGGITRQITVPNTANRYYINRLGHARRAQFALVSKSYQPWKVRGLEIDVAQGLS